MSLSYPEIKDIFDDFIAFLKENKDMFILTGGMAIDFALKNIGHVGIYSSKTNNSEDVDSDNLADNNDYDLFTFDMNIVFTAADLLMAKYQNIKVINAFHPQTLKLRFNKTDIADISFLPKKYFDVFMRDSFLYEGINVISPLVKKADIHKALLCPKRGCPNEAIFHRFKKDMDRYELLDKYFPSPILSVNKGLSINPKKKVIIYSLDNPNFENNSFLISGFLAYALIENEFMNLFIPKEKDFIPISTLAFSKSKIEISLVDFSLNYNLILITDNIHNLTVKKPTYISPFLDDFIPKSIIAKSEGTKYSIEYHEPNTEVTYHTTQSALSSLNNLNIINIHGLMLYFMAMYFKDQNEGYLVYYDALKRMILLANANVMSNSLVITQGVANDKSPLELPFFANMAVWREKNSPEMLIKGLEMHNKMYGIEEQIWPLPMYFPGREKPTIEPHILLEIGYEELKNFNEYKKLKKYEGLY